MKYKWKVKLSYFIAENVANILTVSRIVFAVIMLFVSPQTATFWICYLSAGLSDMADGIVARKLKQESEFGAKLDSIADVIFGCSIAITMMYYLVIPGWQRIWITLIALLRLTGYIIGYGKYHTFSSLHTYANKITGAMIFAFPIIYLFIGINAGGGLVCVVATISTIEEGIITIRSNHLNRDRKSALHGKYQ